MVACIGWNKTICFCGGCFGAGFSFFERLSYQFERVLLFYERFSLRLERSLLFFERFSPHLERSLHFIERFSHHLERISLFCERFSPHLERTPLFFERFLLSFERILHYIEHFSPHLEQIQHFSGHFLLSPWNRVTRLVEQFKKSCIKKLSPTVLSFMTRCWDSWFYFTIKAGHGTCFMTLWLTLPRTISCKLFNPLLPITTRSTCCSLA